MNPDSPVWAALAPLARVPEHSAPLMSAMSGGSPLRIGDYLFYHDRNWLAAIGYPLEGRFSKEDFAKALAGAAQKIAPETVFAIAPAMPSGHERDVVETDRYYVLSAGAAVPARLRNPVKAARAALEITEDAEFTPGHRRLWAEFLKANGRAMKDRVAELYAQTPAAMSRGDLRLLSARDRDGNVVAALLLDHNPQNFSAYILGAHSRGHYVPHATDALFAVMLENARRNGKRFVHLGLGVNEGISRFKRKWGAIPSLPFVMAQWESGRAERREEPAARILAGAILKARPESARRFLQNESSQRPFAMLWQIEKNGRKSWIGGTAHFFLHSFESSFRSLFSRVDNVIFEGPLDAGFMNQVDRAGANPAPGAKPLLEYLNEDEIRRLERTVNGPDAGFARLLAAQKPGRVDVRHILRNSATWHAFFTLWTKFLERQGWRQSVDMEAWRIALAMNKNVIGMENLEEQLESLGSLPPERAVNFFRACAGWKKRAASNLSAYLAGDLERMMGSSAEFPTRTEHIVGRRDQRFRERMRPYLEEGGAAVFVGCAHMVNLRRMIAEDGFSIRQAPYGLWPKLCLAWRNLARPDEKVAW